MKKIIVICTILLIIFMKGLSLHANTQDVEIFDAPQNMTSSSVKVNVADQDVFVYETRVNHNHFWSWETPETRAPVAIFDFDAPVDVIVTLPYDVSTAVLRPLRQGVDVSILGREVRFTLHTPEAYVLELNDDAKQVVHLFTQSIDHNKPNPQDVTYFGPGEHYIGRYTVTSNEHIYIAGGAVIHGHFFGYNVSNVKISGRGIISGETYVRNETTHTVPLELQHSHQITIEGVTFLDPAGWVIHSYFNRDMTIRHINMISARQNGDGVSLQSNHDVYVHDVFVRSWDDSLVVKNYDLGTTSNILFERVTIWTDLAQSMEVGYETYGETMDNITFKDIDVLYNFHKPVISIHNGDQARITNVLFENITVEVGKMTGDRVSDITDDTLIEMTIVDNGIWSTSQTRGYIDGVTVRNVDVIDGFSHLGIKILGFNSTHQIQNVSLENITILGKDIHEWSDVPHEINAFTQNISIDFNQMIPPTLTLNGDANVTLEFGTAYEELGANYDDVVDGTGTAAVSGNVDAFTLGTYVLTYTYTNSQGLEAPTLTRVVEVVDTTSPEVTLIGDDILTVEAYDTFTDPGARFTDGVDGEGVFVSEDSVDTMTLGTYTLTYVYEDQQGNRSNVISRTVEVVDTTPPIITLTGEDTIYIEKGETYIDAGATFNDFVDGTGNVSYSGIVDTNTIGTYVITYTHTDSNGNTSLTLTRTVIVTDVEPLLTFELNPGIDTVEVSESWVDEGVNQDDFIVSLEVIQNVDTSQVGVYEVQYLIEDIHGEFHTLSRIVHVVETLNHSVHFDMSNVSLTYLAHEFQLKAFVESVRMTYFNEPLQVNQVSSDVVLTQTGTYDITLTVFVNNMTFSKTIKVLIIAPPEMIAVVPRKDEWYE